MTATGLVCVLPPAFRRRPLDAGDPSARGLAFSDAEFSMSDGVLLSGWYLPARDGAAVALLHGSGSTRTDVLEQAEGLSHNGFGVLMFDARGHGGSAEQRIRAVVAEGATGRTAADREWLSAA